MVFSILKKSRIFNIKPTFMNTFLEQIIAQASYLMCVNWKDQYIKYLVRSEFLRSMYTLRYADRMYLAFRRKDVNYVLRWYVLHKKVLVCKDILIPPPINTTHTVTVKRTAVLGRNHNGFKHKQIAWNIHPFWFIKKKWFFDSHFVI